MAFFVLREPSIGGMSGLVAQLPPETIRLLPSLNGAASSAAIMTLTVPAFIAFIGIQWWSSWYPGAEPGGGGYIAQRIMSTRTERDSMLATLLYTIAHYCLRPWPWIVVALASLVMYPGLTDTREGFVLVMRDVLPTGILGLMVAAFLAAFMSTISTQLNWGVSYLIHDGWRRFVQRDKPERYYVFLARVATFAVALISIVVTTQLNSIREAWELILTASAGLGLVLVLRWYWWRINAWSELVATAVPILMVIAALAGAPIPGLQNEFPTNLFVVVSITTVLWVVATYITRPTNQSVLQSFYKKVRPPGPGWKPLQSSQSQVPERLSPLFLRWGAGIILVYSTLFLTGYILLSKHLGIAVTSALAILSGAYLWKSLKDS